MLTCKNSDSVIFTTTATDIDMESGIYPGKQVTGKKSKKRRLLITFTVIFITGLICAGSYAYYEFNRKNKDLKNASPDIAISATDLMKTFADDFKVSDSLYKDKVVEVEGTITKIDSTDTPVIFFLGEKGSMSSIQCSMNPEHHETYNTTVVGSMVKMKGMYIGAISQDIFGIDIKLNRCLIIN